MADGSLRAVAVGTTSHCALVYPFILFEHVTQILLYGLYIILICAVQPILQRHAELWKHQSRLATISTLLMLFTLGSAQVAFLISELLSPCRDVKAIVAYSQTLTYIFANFVIGSFFIYRLYVIMARRRSIIVSPIILGHLLGNTIIVFVSTSRVFSSDASEQPERLKSIFRAFLLYNLASNTIVSLLIAGRIWRISRRIQTTLGGDFARTPATIIAMILKSGSAYPAAIAIYLIALSARQDFLSTSLSDGVVFAVLTQIAGIVSTATLFQKAYGIIIADVRIEEVENAVSEWSLSGLNFERTMNENSVRRSTSPEGILIATPNDQIGDPEAGKALS